MPKRSTSCIECGKLFKSRASNQIVCIECRPSYRKKQRKEYRINLRKTNPEKYKRITSKWRRENREKYNTLLQKWNERRRWKCVQDLGGMCVECGIVATKENKCIFDFHHLDPAEKESAHEYRNKNFDLSKVVLLCANCHRLKHFGGF